jgi:hypothetical protein
MTKNVRIRFFLLKVYLLNEINEYLKRDKVSRLSSLLQSSISYKYNVCKQQFSLYFSLIGIMTLSRGPYNELDKMSLFQDLKLKRRKVDSRCSSDGESLADTSTSSPDLLPSISPKICDPIQENPSDTQMQSMQQSSSASSIASATPPPSSTPPISSADLHHYNNNNNNHHQENNSQQFISVRRNLALAQKHFEENNHHHHSTTMPDQSSNNDTKINHPPNGVSSVIIENQRRSHSPKPSSPVIRHQMVGNLLHQQLQQGPSNGNKGSASPQHVTVLVTPPKIKSETNHLMNAITRKVPTSMMSSVSIFDNCGQINAPLSGLSQLHQHHQMHQVPFSTPLVGSSPMRRNMEGSNGNSSPNSHISSQFTSGQPIFQQRIKRERSPNNNMNHHSNFRQQHSPVQSLNVPIPTSSASASMSPIHMRNQQNARDAMIFRIKNETRMPIAPNFIHQQQQQQQHNNQQRLPWGQAPRINGVKPEVIGGPLPSIRQNISPQNSPQQTSPNQNQNNRTTPTVIMGESCGVRTMVWGFEPVISSPPHNTQVQTPTPPNQTPPSTSQNSSHSNSSSSNSNNNEEAAHLLLSLGQGASRPLIDVSYLNFINSFFTNN